MDFENNIPDWVEGTEPSEELKTNGFQTGFKPPAGLFNWFFNLFSKAVKEIQSKLSNVDNTADSEKNVKFASEAGTARKAKYGFIFRLNGGSSEGTDLWTYDGSISKSVNLTPEKLGAAKAINGAHIVAATSEDGIAYTATVDDVTELTNGLEITIIPNTKSTSKSITLNVNGLGAVPIRRPLSFSTFVATSIDDERLYFLSADTPCRLMYHGNYTSGGIWLMADKVKYSAQDLYGTTPIDSGGTGATTAAGAIESLGVYPVGSICCLNTNASPADQFGGTWELVDKEFRSEYKNVTDAFTVGTSVANQGTVSIRGGHSITIRQTVNITATLADSTYQLGTLVLANLGLSKFRGTRNFYAFNKTGGGIAGAISSAGIINHQYLLDTYVSAQSWTIEFTTNVPYEDMLDDFCDKFYWKRTA